MKTYCFKKQVKNRGVYANISYDVTINNNLKNRVINYHADERWQNAVNAGVMIFETYFGKQLGGELEITVYKIDWMMIDSDELIVMFTMICALCDAMGLKSELLKFDPVEEVFILPERRAFYK